MELTGFVILCVLMHAPQHAMSQENVTFPEEPDRGVLDPDLMDVKPPLVVSAPLVSEPVDLSTPDEATNLRWVTAYQQTKGNAANALPPDVVCVHNNYTSRQECVCRPRGVCALGFMTPARGFYCYYSLRGHQLLTADFQLLQNRRNFERLEWRAAENGSVPEHGIKHCRHNYVGRNRYGLGNVHAEMGVLYLPWEGREYWYRDYEVLTVNRDKYHLQVFKMSYDTKKMNVSTLPEVELMESKCMPNLNRTSELITEVYMQTKHEKLNQWEPTLIMPHMLSINFSVKVPEVVLGKDVSASPNTPSDLTEWSGLKLRQNVSLTTHHSAAITPGHCCRVTMLGRKMEVAMPFWAQVRKVYLSGATHAASIVGTYRSTEMGGIKGEPGRCDPLEEEKKEEEKKEVPAERTKPLEATKPPQNPGGGTSAVFPGLSFYASLALCLAVVGVVV